MSHDTTTASEAHARRTDPQTSHDAARSVKNLGHDQARVLALIRDGGPMTDEDIWQQHVYRREAMPFTWKPMSVSGMRTRRGELVRLGLVEKHDAEGLTRTGRACIRWVAVDDASR